MRRLWGFPVMLALALAGAAPLDAQVVAQAQTLYVSTTGSDAAQCTKSAPCASFNRAYHLASLGATVQIAAGAYGEEDIEPPGKSGTGAPIVFTPAPGAKVTTGGIEIVSVNHIELRGFSTGPHSIFIHSSTDGTRPAEDIILRDMTTEEWFIRSSNNIKIIGGDSGYSANADSDTVGAYGTTPARNILIDGTTVHDQQRTGVRCLPPNPSCHPDGIFIQSVDGLILRNTRIYNVDVLPIYISRILDAPTSKNILIENNMVDDPYPSGFYPIQIRWDGTPADAPYENVVIRFNSIGGSINFPAPDNWCVPGTCKVIGNTGPMAPFQCTSSVTYQYNVWQGAQCGPTDRKVSNLSFVGGNEFGGARPFDYRLQRGAPQVDAVPTSVGGPRVDSSGKQRPVRAARDAGAFQWDAASIAPGRRIGGVALGEARQAVADDYGAPQRVSRNTFGVHAPHVTVETRRVHQGLLWVAYDDHDTVVGVGTNSSYYTTPDGAGAGATVARPPSGLAWHPCTLQYLGRRAGTDTWVTVRSKSLPRMATSVWILRGGYHVPRPCSR